MGSWFRAPATATLVGAMEASADPRRHGKGSGARRGFRVWRVKLENAGELKRKLTGAMLYGAQGLPKNLLWYESEYQGMFKASLEARRKSGMGYLRRLPPVPLLVKFTEDGGVVHGGNNAVAVIDLSRRELRIPSLGVRLRLKRGMVESLKGELQRFSDVKFTLWVAGKGLNLTASRETVAWYRGGPLRVIAIDLNSCYGEAVVVMDWDEKEWSMRFKARRKPHNASYHEHLAALVRAVGSRGEQGYMEWWVERRWLGDEKLIRMVYKMFELHSMYGLNVPENAGKAAGWVLRGLGRRNGEFVKGFIHEVRRLVREGFDKGYHVVVVVDEPIPESLNGTPLQRTMLKIVEMIENLCYYEGAGFLSLRASGKRCPLCGAKAENGNGKRKFKHCGFEFDRDFTACYNLTLAALRVIKADAKAVEALKDWLRKHPKALI